MSESVGKPLPDPPKIKKKRTYDSAGTKIAVLAAAAKLFASRGYADTGIRQIAALADVNSGLVGRYFGSKEELFDLALQESLDITPLLISDRANFGSHAADVFFRFDDDRIPNPLTMMILSMSDPAVRAISVAVHRRRVILPLAEWLGGQDSLARAMQITMVWNGLFAGWRLLRLSQMPGADATAAKAWLANSTQAIVDQK